jgi:hypothetical protein
MYASGQPAAAAEHPALQYSDPGTTSFTSLGTQLERLLRNAEINANLIARLNVKWVAVKLYGTLSVIGG